MLWVGANDLVTLDVFQVVHQNALTQHVNERLNVRRHFLFIVCLDELTKIVIRESLLEECDVELISKL